MPHVRSLQRIGGSAATKRDLRDQEHLRLLLAMTLAPDSNCIDVGANVGSVLAEIVRVAPEGHHIGYEPIPELASVLAERFPSVEIREAAASNRKGNTEFCFVRNRPGMSGFRQRADVHHDEVEMLTVRTEDIDSTLPDGFVPALIKIDVEGAEQDVLEGAIETISAHRPIVVIEHGRGAAPLYGTGPEDIHDLLAGRARLRIFDLDGNGPYDRDAFRRAFEEGTYWNFVARP